MGSRDVPAPCHTYPSFNEDLRELARPPHPPGSKLLLGTADDTCGIVKLDRHAARWCRHAEPETRYQRQSDEISFGDRQLTQHLDNISLSHASHPAICRRRTHAEMGPPIGGAGQSENALRRRTRKRTAQSAQGVAFSTTHFLRDGSPPDGGAR